MRVSGGRGAAALAVVLALARAPADALDPTKPLPLYNLDVWTDALPQNTVLTLLQTRDGRLWLGTYEGLVRFDGLDFEAFDERRIPGMRNRRVRALAEDRNGTLWVGTLGSGLVRYRDDTFSAFSAADGLPNDFVQALTVTADGSLWVGTSGGLGRLRDGRFTTFRKRDGLSSESIQALAEGPDGTLWIGSEMGLDRLRGERFESVPLGAAGKPPQVASLCVARDGTLYVGTIGTGLYRIAGGVTTHFAPEAGFPAPYVPAVREDRHGTIWLATYPGGLARLRDGKFETLDTRHGLPNNSVRSLVEDREGSLWVGTNGGLARLKDLKFVNVSTRQGLSEGNVRVVTEARGGGLWVGTYGGGVDHIGADGSIRVYGEREGLSDLYVRSLLEDSRGDLWVGTTGGGLDRIRDGRVEVFKEKDGLSGSNVNAIYEKRDGTILAVTQEGGLDVLRGRRFVPLLDYDRRALGNVRVLLEDSHGTLWLGTYDRGLLEVHGDEVVRVWKEPDGVPSNVFALYEEPAKETLWIGTHAGLCRLRGGRVSSVGSRAGLPDDVVFQILDDRRGAFWLTANRGLTRVDRASLDAVLDGTRSRISAVLFGKADGMGSSQCNGATQPAGVVMRDGRLAIPTAGGLTLVDPANLHVNAVPPPVDVTLVLVNGRPVDRKAETELPWQSDRFEIRYAGLSLLQPERVTFRYRMEGLDRDWIDAGSRRTAFYNSLPPGRHAFRVQARNNDGFWSDEEGRFEFSLPAPPWRRWWAVLGYLALVGGAFVGVLRARERAHLLRSRDLEARVAARTAELFEALRRVEASEAKAVEASGAKSAFLANMSHELRTPLNAILGFAEILLEEGGLGEDQLSHVNVINQSGRHLLGLINDVLSLSQIEAGQVTMHESTFDLRRVVVALVDMVRVRAKSKGLRLSVEIADGVPALVRGDEGKLRQMVLNLLSNAVKFTERGGVTVRVAWKEDRGTFDVEDTGPGISPDEIDRLFSPFVQSETGRKSTEGTGLGLVISRRFARLLGGDLTVRSEPGRGSTFHLEILLPEAAVAKPLDAGTKGPGEPRSRRFAEGQEVLIAEDHPINRELARELLRRAGLSVTAVADGNEALEQLSKKKFDAVLMDVEMPNRDGLSAVKEIRADERFRDLPVVAMTAHALAGDRERFLAAGMSDYVAKPIEPEVLFGVLERWLKPAA